MLLHKDIESMEITMIYCLTGDLLYSDAANCTAVIDCGGVGYAVNATAGAIAKLPPPCPDGGVRVRIFTYMNVRDDGIDLFGFVSEEELAMFKRLISVSGVGPKAALSILSLLSPDKFAAAVLSGDQKAISKAPGVGAKTAARIILELKEKLEKLYTISGSDSGNSEFPAAADTMASDMKDAADALLVLGYSKQEINDVLGRISGISGTENIIKAALSRLM